MKNSTGDEMTCCDISCIDEVLMGKGLLLGERCLNEWDHLKIRCGRRGGVDISHQMSSGFITPLGDMNVVSCPDRCPLLAETAHLGGREDTAGVVLLVNRLLCAIARGFRERRTAEAIHAAG